MSSLGAANQALVPQLPASNLSDQLEALGDEIDVNSLNLTMAGKTALQIRQMITAASITRTIRGASTLQVTIQDSDLAITRSGFLGGSGLTVTPAVASPTRSGISFDQPVDCELDGLYFRLVGVQKDDTDYSFTLTFEDREIAVLRSYPRRGDPATYKVFEGLDRIAVMAQLVAEPVEYFKAGGIRFYSPLVLTSPTGVASVLIDALAAGATAGLAHARTYGFPPATPPTTVTGGGFTVSAPGATPITVKGAKATPKQLAVLDAVIRAGVYQARVAEWLLVVAVMVVTQESNAGQASSNVFQQEAQFYPGVNSTDPFQAAVAFYAEAQQQLQQHPTMAMNYALTAAQTQRPLLYLQTGGFPSALNPTGGTTTMYGQWFTEAQATVDAYLGQDDPNLPPPNLKGAAPLAALSPVTAAPPSALLGSAVFSRGSMTNQGGRMIVVEENNWACLRRLADEVGWLLFCVSGTIYVTDWSIFHTAVRMRIKDSDPGIDGIGFEIQTGLESARVTVTCRISRWGAPPGTVVAIDDMGPASGRWLVESIERDLFSFDGTITLVKPQTTLKDAESASPVQGIQILSPSGLTTGQAGQVIVGDSSQGLGRVAANAIKAAQLQASDPTSYRWAEIRPMPPYLYPPPQVVTDCSGFATLCYKAAQLPDPNGPLYNYNGQGDTASLIANGTPTANPKPGDLAFWGFPGQKPYHVVVYIGNDPNGNAQCVSLGGGGDPKIYLVKAQTDFFATAVAPAVPFLGYYRYSTGGLGT